MTDYFDRKLQFETDAADVGEALRDGTADFVLVDSRSERAYEDAHLPGAISLVQVGIEGLPPGPIVVYCWGPGCNGAAGREVKEMIGGFEYYVREGFEVEGTPNGLVCSLPVRT